MICLTGDVHQKSYRGTDTPYSDYSEVQLAQRYCQIAEQYGVKVTLFLTGKACLEEEEGVQNLSLSHKCEIGGHTFSAFRGPLYSLFKKMSPTPAGPRAYQIRDIRRTISAIHKTTGKTIITWRNHAYIRNEQTDTLLSLHNIQVVSDNVTSDTLRPQFVENKIISLPINTPPDHENLIHGKYREGKTKAHRLEGRMSIEEWGVRVKENIHHIHSHGGVATVLAHPLCMEVADGMKTFESLCQFINQFPTIFASEVRNRF
jgi:hypothetical protein